MDSLKPMILQFPDLNTFRLAVVSGTVSQKHQYAPAKIGLSDEGLVFVKATGRLTKKETTELAKIGAKSVRKVLAQLRIVQCWPQFFELTKISETEITDRTPVLFGFKTEEQFVRLASEIMRLGNDRQSYRFLDDPRGQFKGILRVFGPPYYSLLSAIEPSQRNGDPNSSVQEILAFTERAPGIWIQFGYNHPLLSRVTVPAGEQLLIESSQHWHNVKEAPYKDIYETLDIELPDSPIRLEDRPLEAKISVPLGLEVSGSGDPAELWVLKDRASEQVEKLIRSSDNQLLSRLAFAVAETDDETTVVVRLRPSKQPAPVVVLDGIEFRPYLKLPNLFLPTNKRLNPPLRRDAVAKLLANDSAIITWLYPDENRGGFRAEQIMDSAFQPIENWVDYVMDREATKLTTWSKSFQYEFEQIICGENKAKPPKPKLTRQKKKQKTRSDHSSSLENESETQSISKKKDSSGESSSKVTFEPLEAVRPEPTHIQKELAKIEDEFQGVDEPVDGESRPELWQKMGNLNGLLGRRHDSTVCWSNGIWDDDLINEPNNPAVQKWLESEMGNCKVDLDDEKQVAELLEEMSVNPRDVSVVAALIIHAANFRLDDSDVKERLDVYSNYLQRNEEFIPLRTAWMAWRAIYQLSEGDLLGLVRARDRLLERLFRNGMAPEFDMASFMRTKGLGNNDHHRLLAQQVSDLSALAIDWVVEPQNGNPQTRSYAKLAFAFGLARLGEAEKTKILLEEAVVELNYKDSIHGWLGKAFEYRTSQAISAQPHEGPLPTELIDSLQKMENMGRYKVDKLRRQSRILEPHVRVDPYSRWHMQRQDELTRQLMELESINAADGLEKAIHELLEANKSKPANYLQVLAKAIELGPAVGEKGATGLIDLVLTWLPKIKDPIEQALLIQKAMFLAGHYGHLDAVQTFVGTFNDLLPAIVKLYLEFQIQFDPNVKVKVDTIESLFSDSFKSMRKLGLRDEIGQIYSHISKLVDENSGSGKRKRTAKNSRQEIDPTRPLRLLLCVAGGWYYFGQIDDAEKICLNVRKTLFEGDLPRNEQLSLACAYVNAVAMAPPEKMIALVSELFEVKGTKRKRVQKLQRITDNLTTTTHFSISQLELIESTIMAIVSDDFSLDQESQRWLDEDEFLVRRRINDDVQLFNKT